MTPTPIIASNMGNGWISTTLIIMLFLMIWIRLYHPKKFGAYLKAFIARRFLKQLAREEEMLSHPLMLVLFINSMFAIALSCYYLLFTNLLFTAPLVDFDASSWVAELGLFLFIALSFAVLYFGKVLFHNTFKVILSVDEAIKEFISLFMLNINVLGVVLLPFLIAVTFLGYNYNVWALVAILIIIGLFFLLRLINGLINAFSYSFFKPYIFLYLCALEILPVMFVIAFINR